MTHADALHDIEARYECGLLSFGDLEHELDALEYAHGEAMTAADNEGDL